LTIFDAVVLAAAANPGEGGTEPSPGGGFGQYGLLIFMAAIVVFMWFMSRRNKKQQQAQGDFRRTLDVGHRVMTVGGMIGTVTGVQGDVLTLMSPSGDESAYIRRAIKSEVSDEEWANLTQPYPEEEDEDEGVDEEVVEAGAEDIESADSADASEDPDPEAEDSEPASATDEEEREDS
jgi:preprotein translocase subunit YajC